MEQCDLRQCCRQGRDGLTFPCYPGHGVLCMSLPAGLWFSDAARGCTRMRLEYRMLTSLSVLCTAEKGPRAGGHMFSCDALPHTPVWGVAGPSPSLYRNNRARAC